jgi:hypothetical protein
MHIQILLFEENDIYRFLMNRESDNMGLVPYNVATEYSVEKIIDVTS